tara:strand:+ start:3834 stop:4979 length:1146 start_codon:yes stop_codon:yes gene_type:complete
MQSVKNTCFAIKNNISLLTAHIAAKFRDDLLIGTEHSHKIIPECDTPQVAFLTNNHHKRTISSTITTIRVNNENNNIENNDIENNDIKNNYTNGDDKKDFEFETIDINNPENNKQNFNKNINKQNVDNELTDDEKKEIVIADPKFGMFSLFKYHMTRGYKNEVLRKKNAVYCSHIFSSIAFLPLIIFIAQWSMYIALIANQIDNYDNHTLCPNSASWKEKLIMFGACGLYFVKSFFLWDNLTDRTRLNKMIPATDSWTMLDTFQEFGFNLFVYGANIWIVFVGDSVDSMVVDCLAMEFLMNLDNEFERMYFEYLPEAAVDIYDNVFITYKENYDLLQKKNNNCGFCCMHFLTFIPFKLLLTSLLLFPVFCFFMMIYSPICK